MHPETAAFKSTWPLSEAAALSKSQQNTVMLLLHPVIFAYPTLPDGFTPKNAPPLPPPSFCETVNRAQMPQPRTICNGGYRDWESTYEFHITSF